jgi:hypothetical protein
MDLGRFFSFLIHTQSIELIGGGLSPSQGRYLHTEQHKHRTNAQRHPCLEWDSNHDPSVRAWTETVHALDRAATGIGSAFLLQRQID